MMLGVNFIGLSYLLVYVGAVSILFLFILMLINVRVSELVTDNSNSIPLAIMIGIFFNITLSKLMPSNFSIYFKFSTTSKSSSPFFKFISKSFFKTYWFLITSLPFTRPETPQFFFSLVANVLMKWQFVAIYFQVNSISLWMNESLC